MLLVGRNTEIPSSRFYCIVFYRTSNILRSIDNYQCSIITEHLGKYIELVIQTNSKKNLYFLIRTSYPNIRTRAFHKKEPEVHCLDYK